MASDHEQGVAMGDGAEGWWASFFADMPYGHMRASLQSFNPIDGVQATPLHQLHPSPMSMSKQGVAMVEGAGMWWASSVAGMLHDQIQGCLQSFSPIG